MLPDELDLGPVDSPRPARLAYHAMVRELPSSERLAQFGEQALSLGELLAIVLRTGSAGESAPALANRLLSRYGGLPGLARANLRKLCAERGMGQPISEN